MKLYPYPLTLTTADISISTSGPTSNQFDDIYFSPDNGYEETKHVFIKGSGLIDVFQNKSTTGNTHLLPNTIFIGETGFGTGLNFFTAMNEYHLTQSTHQQLHYHAIEGFPVDRNTLIQIHQQWQSFPFLPKTRQAMKQFQNQYPDPITGVYTFQLVKHITLTLWFYPADIAFKKMSGFFDIWFLDGFNPKTNPDFWSDHTFSHIAKMSHDHTRLATFTVARSVRDQLNKYGFAVNKLPGYGKKRDMLTAVKQPNHQASLQRSTIHIHEKTSVAIIGAGIAGCTTAWELAKYNFDVHLIDQHTDIAEGCSGNPVASLFVQFSPFNQAFNEFQRSAYHHAFNQLSAILSDQHRLQHPKMIQMLPLIHSPSNTREHKRLKDLIDHNPWSPAWLDMINHASAETVAGIPLEFKHAFLYPNSAIIQPKQLCRWLIQQNPTHLHSNCKVDKLIAVNDRWQLICDDALIGDNTFDHVILTSGYASGHFIHRNGLNMIGGQITSFPENTLTRPLKAIISNTVYLTPSFSGWHTLGSTFKPGVIQNHVLDADHGANIAQLNQLSCRLSDKIDQSTLKGKAGTRCQHSDYLPSIGQYNPNESNSNVIFSEKQRPHLWTNYGHGSKGFTTSWIGATLIRQQLLNQPISTSQNCLDIINPNRFSK